MDAVVPAYFFLLYQHNLFLAIGSSLVVWPAAGFPLVACLMLC